MLLCVKIYLSLAWLLYSCLVLKICSCTDCIFLTQYSYTISFTAGFLPAETWFCHSAGVKWQMAKNWFKLTIWQVQLSVHYTNLHTMGRLTCKICTNCNIAEAKSTSWYNYNFITQWQWTNWHKKKRIVLFCIGIVWECIKNEHQRSKRQRLAKTCFCRSGFNCLNRSLDHLWQNVSTVVSLLVVTACRCLEATHKSAWTLY